MTQLGRVSPDAFARRLQAASFLLGLGRPELSPSPFEALAAGAAFLNARYDVVDPGARGYQHDALATLGAPYVYNVQLRDAPAVVAAARKAVRLRFASYVPAAFTRAAVVDRVCRSILEDVGPCLCATPGGAATDADCRNASLYTRTFFAAAPPGGGG